MSRLVGVIVAVALLTSCGPPRPGSVEPAPLPLAARGPASGPGLATHGIAPRGERDEPEHGAEDWRSWWRHNRAPTLRTKGHLYALYNPFGEPVLADELPD